MVPGPDGTVGMDDAIEKQMDIEEQYESIRQKYTPLDVDLTKSIDKEIKIAQQVLQADPAAAVRRYEKANNLLIELEVKERRKIEQKKQAGYEESKIAIESTGKPGRYHMDDPRPFIDPNQRVQETQDDDESLIKIDSTGKPGRYHTSDSPFQSIPFHKQPFFKPILKAVVSIVGLILIALFLKGMFGSQVIQETKDSLKTKNNDKKIAAILADARLLRQKGLLTKAREKATEALSIEPDNAQTNKLIDSISASIKEAERLAAIEAAKQEAAKQKAEELARLKAKEEAEQKEAARIAAIEEAKRIEAERIAAKKEAERMAALKEAKRKEDQYKTNMLIAKNYMLQKRWEKAAAKFKEVLQTNPNDSIAREKLAEVEKRIPILIDCGLNVEMKFCFIPAGEFMMGDSNHSSEKPVHRVEITKAFFIGAYEVTQKQYETVMKKKPSYFKGEDNPVESISWSDAQKFCKKLSQKTGKKVRLPTEAEWEYACRANTKKEIYNGILNTRNISAIAWYNKNSKKRTQPVGQKEANEFGLYDMSGNVWEWCSDWYDSNYYAKSAESDPTGPRTGENHVRRGGSWYNRAENCRSASRDKYHGKNPITGFRVVLEK